MSSEWRSFANHRKGWMAAGVVVAVVGLTLGLLFSVAFDNSPTHARTTTRAAPSATNPPTGIGPGVNVADPPGPNSGEGTAPAGLTSLWTGTCGVAILNEYKQDDWRAQTKCAGAWGDHAHLVTIRNDSPVPVFVNEWYTGQLHGQTTILAGQTVIMPVWGAFTTSLYVGACWPGPGGPGTCQNGATNRRANVEIIRWEEVPQGNNVNGYMFVRDHNTMGLPARRTSSYTAVNVGDYAVQLHWPELGRNKWVDLPLKGRIENIPPGDIEGRKEKGSGAVALVSITGAPRPDGEDIYNLVSPSARGGVPPFAYMTWLNGTWCSVHLENLGPAGVIVQSWSTPYLVPGGGQDLVLEKGASGTLYMKRLTHFLTGHVGTGSTGQFTLLKATRWKHCD